MDVLSTYVQSSCTVVEDNAQEKDILDSEAFFLNVNKKYWAGALHEQTFPTHTFNRTPALE